VSAYVTIPTGSSPKEPVTYASLLIREAQSRETKMVAQIFADITGNWYSQKDRSDEKWEHIFIF
jgi:hypothetical protein